jgi:penicillin-binding protein 2
VAIGQGAVSVTPLQVARAISALVNGGKLHQPILVKEITSRDKKSYHEVFEPKIVSNLEIEPWVLEEVKKVLVPVVNEQRGTAYKSRLSEDLGVQMAGKTGTAQTMRLELSPDDDNDLAWFAGYAPLQNTEIVAVATVEKGGHGGTTAAPIVKAVVEAYFRSKNQNVN